LIPVVNISLFGLFSSVHVSHLSQTKSDVRLTLLSELSVSGTQCVRRLTFFLNAATSVKTDQNLTSDRFHEEAFQMLVR